MEYLSKKFSGTLHNPNLCLDDDEEDDEDDDGIEVVPLEVKSSRTLIREKYDRAKISGQVISLLAATTTQTRSSIQSTFSSISATVAAMRGTNRAEREVVIKPTSAMITYQATRMILQDNAESISFVIAPGETSNER